MHVAGERRVVGEHALAADDAVVRDVRAGHEQVVAANARDALVLHRAAMDRDALADHVAVADLETRRLAAIFLVLGIGADRGELEDPIALADRASAPR